MIVDTTQPPRPTVTTDSVYVHETQQVHFVIDMVNPLQDVIGYRYRILQPSGTVFLDWQTILTKELHYDVIHDGINLLDGTTYSIAVEAQYQDQTHTATGWGTITIDSTAPTDLRIQSPAYSSTQNLRVSWSAVENISHVRYWAKIGTTSNDDDVLPLTLFGQIEQYTFTRLVASDGDVLYVTVIAENGSGLTTVEMNDPIIIDNSCPEEPMVIDDGMYTNVNTELDVSWTWSLEDPQSGIANYEVALVKARSVNENTNWTSLPATEKHYTFNQTLTNGDTYFVAVKAINRAGLFSIGYSDGILVDTSRPNPPSINDYDDFIAYVSGLGTLTADASGTDPQSGISGYYYSLGTIDSPNSLIHNELVSTSNVLGRSGLALQVGEVYFFRVIAENNAGDISAESMSDGIMVVNGTEPRIQTIIDGGQYINENQELFFVWEVNNIAIPIDHYEYCLIDNLNTETSEDQWKSTYEKRAKVSAPEGTTFIDGRTYYLVVRVVNKLEQKTEGKTSDGITIDTTPPDPPILDTDKYVTSNLQLKWTANDQHSGIVAYSYAIGTTRGGNNIKNWTNIDTTVLLPAESTTSINRTVAITNLTNRGTYYLTVKAQNGVGMWSTPVMSGELIADLNPPTTPEVAGDAYTTDRTRIENVSIKSNDPLSGIFGYRYAVVTSNTLVGDLSTPTHNLSNVQNEMDIKDLDISDLTLEEGAKYYVAVQTVDRLGQWSAIGYSAPIIVDTIPPDLAFDDFADELVTNTGVLEVDWNTNETGTLYYRLITLNSDGTSATDPDFYPLPISKEEEFTGSFSFQQPIPGLYMYEIYQVDFAGNQTLPYVTKQIRHNCPPYVIIYASETTIYQGQSITFTLDAGDGDGTVTDYQWSVDGVGATFSPEEEQNQLTVTFSALGTHVVGITVTDNDTATAAALISITVTNTLSGELAENEIWSGNLKFTGSVRVPSTRSLIIEPGARLEFPLDATLIVEGTLQLQGDPVNPIVMTGTHWKGIEIHQTAKITEISHLHISKAERGLALIGLNPQICYVTFDQNAVGLHLYKARPLVNQCYFTNNEYFGIKEDLDANATVTNSVFTGNGLSPYYDVLETWLTIEQLNLIPGNEGNTE